MEKNIELFHDLEKNQKKKLKSYEEKQSEREIAIKVLREKHESLKF